MPDEEAECIHGLGPVSACTICNGREKREAVVDRDATKYEYEAKHYSRCGGCSGRIEPGDAVTVTNDDTHLCPECS